MGGAQISHSLAPGCHAGGNWGQTMSSNPRFTAAVVCFLTLWICVCVRKTLSALREGGLCHPRGMFPVFRVGGAGSESEAGKALGNLRSASCNAIVNSPAENYEHPLFCFLAQMWELVAKILLSVWLKPPLLFPSCKWMGSLWLSSYTLANRSATRWLPICLSIPQVHHHDLHEDYFPTTVT